MIYFILIFWFLIFIKLLFFWLWLWQLKEYHIGRFLAHFETQAAKKILSSFWRLKYPKFTKKIIVISFTSVLLAALLSFFLSASLVLFFIVLAPLIFSLIVLIFQIPTVIWRKRLLEKAREKRQSFKNLLVIGITGSYGKTSTKEFLATILSEKYKVLKTKKNQNSEVGISQCILNDLKPEHEIFVCEMGAYSRGGIKLLCDIARPKIGILTGISEQHMSTFGSQENIIKTKYELIESLPQDGLAILNGDNDYCYELFKKTINSKRIYSSQPTIANFPTDIYTSSVAVNREFLSFKVLDKSGESAIFKVSLSGGHNVLNILAAACCAEELGMTLEEIALASQKIESWQSGMQLKKGINGLNIIDATYSANPDGVLSHLEYLKIWPGKKIIIMPCLIELGDATIEVHKRIGEKIGEICDLSIITTRERFQEIGEGAIEKGMKGENILFTENPKEIFEKVRSFCQEGDVILLESRVPEEVIESLSLC